MDKYPDFIESTGYGTGEGLCGWNCYHSFSPFIPGISVPTYTAEQLEEMNRHENTPKEYQGKQYTDYQATQRQRRLETQMRAERQKIHLLQVGGADEKDITSAKCRYRATSAEYARFSKAMDLPQQRERVTIDGLGDVRKTPAKVLGKLTSSDNLTSEQNNDTIMSASNAHSRNIELENAIKRCIKAEIPIFDENLLKSGLRKAKFPEDMYFVALHGSDTKAWIWEIEITPSILANIIKSRSDYKNQDIFLFSCNTGNTTNTGNCFAQLLANELKVNVIAPTEYGVIWSSGRYYSGNENNIPSGEFKKFFSRE